MPREEAPQPVVDLAEARAIARRARDRPTAGPLRGPLAPRGARAPDGPQLVVVANGSSDAQAAGLAALDAVDPGAPGISTEVVWTSERLGPAAALNAGLRRAAAPVV